MKVLVQFLFAPVFLIGVAAGVVFTVFMGGVRMGDDIICDLLDWIDEEEGV